MNIFKWLTTIPYVIKGAKIGKNCYFAFGARIIGINISNLKIGDNVIIGRRSWIGHLKQGKIFIGKNTTLGGDIVISSSNSISIGDGVLTSYRVTIVDHYHKFYNGVSPVSTGVTFGEPINIGNNCFIGANSCIFGGVTLGEGCIVSANSMVNRSFPANSVIGGVPAQILKFY